MYICHECKVPIFETSASVSKDDNGTVLGLVCDVCSGKRRHRSSPLAISVNRDGRSPASTDMAYHGGLYHRGEW